MAIDANDPLDGTHYYKIVDPYGGIPGPYPWIATSVYMSIAL